MNEQAVEQLLEKLGQFRGSLPDDERQVLDGILLAACGRQADVEVYSLDAATVQRAALGAVVGFGLFMGSFAVPSTARAQVGELESPSIHPRTVSAVPAALTSITISPSVPQRDDNDTNPRPQ
jgi:hypothetical protein